MKHLKLILAVVVAACLWAGCQTPGKYIAATSTTVDHAMQAWAVYVVDGHATPEQEERVRSAKLRYDLAEDAAVAAYVSFTTTGDKSAWLTARDFLNQNQQQLIELVTLFTGKKK